LEQAVTGLIGFDLWERQTHVRDAEHSWIEPRICRKFEER
jgi:hypothetical protein